MYTDVRRARPLAVILIVLIIASAAGIYAADPGKDISDESAAAIREAVERSALECYAVEGIYPPSLEYLEENYGLSVNRQDFYITYEAFASNIAPHVVVTRRHR